MNSKLFATAILLLVSLAIFGCIQTSQAGTSTDANKIKALENSNKKLQAVIEQLQLQVGVYKSLNDCKEKALIAVIDKNSGVEQTTLKDAFDRCNTVFSAMKAMAEKPA